MPNAPQCAACGEPVRDTFWNDPDGTTCGRCLRPVHTHVYPVYFAPPEAALPEAIEGEGEASCFYHASSRAVLTCDACGRFLCALCDLHIDARHMCPSCLDRGARDEKQALLETTRTQYDSLALHLVTWPILTVWLPLFCAPAALYIVIRHWRTPTSLVPRTRVRYWIALVLAIAEVIGILALIVALIVAAATPNIP